MKALAAIHEMRSSRFESMMRDINTFADAHGLRSITNWSKIWEYPWIETRIAELIRPAARILDIGSEISPMPWRWALRGARVMMVETNGEHVEQWTALRERLSLAPHDRGDAAVAGGESRAASHSSPYASQSHTSGEIDWRILSDEKLPFPDQTFDLVTSFSVIEHMPDKRRAVDEAVRILRPGGALAISFDVCESGMGMAFPDWNGRALTLDDFDDLVWRHSDLCPLDENAVWNVHDAPEYLAWHRTTAPHHTYVVGAAIMLRKKAG